MTDAQRVAGGVRNPSLSQTSADQITILGNGTDENPLSVGIGNPFFDAEFVVVGFSRPEIGGSVAIRADDVTPATGVARVENAVAASSGSAQVIGLLVQIDGSAVRVQTTGQVVLTEAQWNNIIGSSGHGTGLSPGSVYFLDVVIGHLTTAAPSAPTTSVAQVGIAMNPTTLLLSLPAVPVLNE